MCASLHAFKGLTNGSFLTHYIYAAGVYYCTVVLGKNFYTYN